MPAVDDHGREHEEHHHEVGEGQVDDQQVAGRLERGGAHEHVDHGEIADEGDHAHHEDHEAED